MWRWGAGAAGVLVVLSGAVSPVADAAPVVLEVEPQAVSRPVADMAYPSLEADLSPAGDVRWNVVTGVGNCCENYVATTPNGRLANFGGTYLHFSDDAGRSWSVVRPPTPLLSGEGAVTVGPGGDILGVGWDPYTGDHLQSFKYDAADDSWWYAEAPIKTPFYDRPWISVVPGPVTVGVETVPYATVIRGGWPTKEVLYYATDGIRYLYPAVRQAEVRARPVVSGPLPVTKDPLADYSQSHAETLVVPLGNGAVLGRGGWPGDGWSGCNPPTFVAVRDLAWQCHQPAGETVHWQAADSDGWLHAVVWSPNGRLEYVSSPDGGATVHRQVLPLPDGFEVLGSADVDLKANAAAGVVAIASHARNLSTQRSQHLVYRLRKPTEDEPGDQYVLERLLFVGAGDLAFGSGVTESGARFDFASVAILPDGRIAVSFNDAAHTNPALAVEVEPPPPRD